MTRGTWARLAAVLSAGALGILGLAGPALAEQDQVTRTAVVAGAGVACTLDGSGQPGCWGSDGLTYQMDPPPGVAFTKLALSGHLSCGLDTATAVHCWGQAIGFPGRADINDLIPAGTYTDVTVGQTSAQDVCAVATDGTLACGGSDTWGQTQAPTGTYTQVSLGSTFGCALRTDATLACWGDNTDGRATPPSGTFTKVAAGSTFGCALATDATVTCWGDNTDGRATAPTGHYEVLAAGAGTACAVDVDYHQPTCWGENNAGQANPPHLTTIGLSVGLGFACLLEANSHWTHCWGDNTQDELGSVAMAPSSPTGQMPVLHQPYDEPWLSADPMPTLTLDSGSLPPGLTYDPVTGHLHGTPTQAGDFTGQYHVSNPLGVNWNYFAVSVYDEPAGIWAHLDRAANASGWFTTTPVVSFQCVDGSHPLATPCPTPVNVPDGKAQIVTRQVTTVDSQTLTASTAALNVDTHAPVVKVGAGPAFATGLSVPVTWSATDGVSGVATVSVQYASRPALSGSLSSWHALSSSTSATGAKALSGAAGTMYCVRASATDKVGHTSTWTTPTCTTFGLDDRALTRATSGWVHETRAGWLAGTDTSTTRSTTGATLTSASLSGLRQVGVIATRCPTCGTITLYLGSAKVGAISLYAPTTTARSVLVLPRFTSTRAGKVRLVVTSRSKLVRIDALEVSNG